MEKKNTRTRKIVDECRPSPRNSTASQNVCKMNWKGNLTNCPSLFWVSISSIDMVVFISSDRRPEPNVVGKRRQMVLHRMMCDDRCGPYLRHMSGLRSDEPRHTRTEQGLMLPVARFVHYTDFEDVDRAESRANQTNLRSNWFLVGELSSVWWHHN